MNTKIISAVALSLSLAFSGCNKEKNYPEIAVDNLTIDVQENIARKTIIGNANATLTNVEYVQYYLGSEDAPLNDEPINIDSKGNIYIQQPDYFDFEKNQSYTVLGEIVAGNSKTNDVSSGFSILINITDVNETGTPTKPTVTVQQRLDKGETPKQIYDSGNNLLDSLYGKTYLNGLIFYFNPATGKGMLAAKSDQSASLVWDYNKSNLKATGATAKGIGKGEANTFTIATIIGSGGTYAAQTCSDAVIGGYSGWFLPSLDELEQMYKKLHKQGIGNFQNTKYWSSSEADANSAWYRDFAVANGQIASTKLKIDTLAVRAFRNF